MIKPSHNKSSFVVIDDTIYVYKTLDQNLQQFKKNGEEPIPRWYFKTKTKTKNSSVDMMGSSILWIIPRLNLSCF